MCGIAGVYIKDPSVIGSHRGLEQFVDDLHLGIESRGRKAAGFVAVSADGSVKIDKAPLTASEFIKEREKLPENTRIVLLHTRLDTKGTPKDSRNNHPVIHKTAFTTHNGWIRNDDELFEKYEFDRVGEVDSEIIPALLYAADFDVEKMKKAFDEMEGPIACATIDPIRHPGKLILARTEASPLEYIDTPKFLIWASEKKAIREAWGRHIGTPPKEERITSLERQKMLIVTEDGIEEHKIPYTPKGYTGGYSGYGGYTGYSSYGGYRAYVDGSWGRWVQGKFIPDPKRAEGNSQSTTSGRSGTRTVSPADTQTFSTSCTNEEIKARVLAIREGGEGVSKLWVNKFKYPLRTKLGPWMLCEVCEATVNKADLRESLRGRICTDCHTVWMKLAAKKRNDAAKEAPPPEDKPWAIVNGVRDWSERTVDQFNTWAEDEEFVHNMALHEVSKHTGFSENALEYLLFRTTETQEAEVDGLAGWKSLITEVYDFEYTQAWQYYDNDGGEWNGMDILEPPKPKEQLALPPAPVTTYKILFEQNMIGSKGKCHLCRKKCTHTVEREPTVEKLAFCAKHFNICSFKGCGKQANHTLGIGTRVCHNHARGRKECYSDTFLKGAGYLVGSRE